MKQLKGTERVETLDFTDNTGLGDKSAIIITKLIADNKALTSLVLSNNNIRAEGAKALADALASGTTALKLYLKSLDLRNNYLGPQGGEALGAALAVHTALTSPDLKGQDIIGAYKQKNDHWVTLLLHVVETTTKSFNHQVISQFINLEIKFPHEYPKSPLFVRVVWPRFHYQTGHVTAVGGSICAEWLTLVKVGQTCPSMPCSATS